jgi:hypothetical protein
MPGSLETVDANVDADRERVELHRLQAPLTVSEQLNQIRGAEQRAMDKHPRTRSFALLPNTTLDN